MKKLSEKKILFCSEDIRIQSYTDRSADYYMKSDALESRSGFTLLFLLSNDIHLEAPDCRTSFRFGKNQYILHFLEQESKAELWTENQTVLEYLQIDIDYQYMLHLIQPAPDSESADILERLIKNRFIFLHQQTPPSITVEMHMIIKEIVGYSKKGVLQKLFIEAKVIKLLMLILEQFSEKDSTDIFPGTPETVKKYIDDHYHTHLRTEDIARLIGINQNTIRKEFKSRYHITVSDYIAELRMLKAKKMIIDRKVMIKEIAIECGYEYVQNFTRAFKKKFGISPEKLRNE
ncbi:MULTISPECIES: helix-turn-helix transcriptional regulator [Chryseobacterium]|uniref:AraC-like DNA-binding protein n=1 Tax=Chryseobacterium camelliae TaxID=1265445 RepID=A0ABU0TP49_9FLAO|nr:MULTISPECIES: AraC family transcriptional regulator [Chryseobacterium]MDT3408101.1 AraC-like DNA-binding protein [Pseudacidovorax intermedius]MDQ1098043.1 AraC-like DNA-binding protein [Chryseobacterium camelliae]MDQ1101973.1 AraC-like DNA-binding protein [Chryseobacterium sp. SORGH_AS_1048]MDR6085411.1 AraC-like DNA-binding protein [Chryseobacterium sp. SORGH_AS_0909]MDR6129774.1 AraC-like DNA-binding protein [Chryseobacterium sp. SORGH_AS_1175]